MDKKSFETFQSQLFKIKIKNRNWWEMLHLNYRPWFPVSLPIATLSKCKTQFTQSISRIFMIIHLSNSSFQWDLHACYNHCLKISLQRKTNRHFIIAVWSLHSQPKSWFLSEVLSFILPRRECVLFKNQLFVERSSAGLEHSCRCPQFQLVQY